MAITYVGAGAEATATAGGNPAVPYPASITAGDILIIACSSGVSTAWATNAVTGFTRRTTVNGGGSSPSGAIYYKIATGSETGTRSITSPGGASIGRMFAYRGVDQTNTFDVADVTFGSSAATTAYDIPAQTTTIAGCMLAHFVFSNTTTGSFAPAPDQGGYTELWESSGGAVIGVVEYAHVVSWGSSGDTTIRSVVRTGSIRGGGIGIALRPATSTQLAASGQVDAVSDAVGSVTQLLLAAAGSAVAVSGLLGAATSFQGAAGQVDVTSAVTGEAAVAFPSSGTVAGVSGATGAASRAAAASGTIAATSGATGSAEVLLGATGQVDVVSGVTGSATIRFASSGTVAAVTSVSGAATASRVVPPFAFALSTDAYGSAVLSAPASGQVDVVSGVSGAAGVAGDITLAAVLDEREWSGTLGARQWAADLDERPWEAHLDA